jgi:hypothetical protein
MPGFSFSPTMIGQTAMLIMKSGNEIEGVVREVNPVEVVLKVSGKHRLIRVNRDEIDAYTGTDDVKRSPDSLRLHVTRCYNATTKCNGVKAITVDPGTMESFKGCPARNEFCQCNTMNFFDMQKISQIKLLRKVLIGSYPEKTGEEE